MGGGRDLLHLPPRPAGALGIWYRISPVNESAEGWSANQNRVTMQSQYTSLPSDALEKYLLDGESIAVHDLDSRVAGVPGEDGYPGIQQAERTYSLMNYVSNSLGVNCLFCHNSRAFYSASGQITPQWATEMLGIDMVLELNNTYLAPLEGCCPSIASARSMPTRPRPRARPATRAISSRCRAPT